MDTERYTLRSARFLAHECLRGVVRPGDRAVDATMGNGHDTLLLAELVGDAGHVTAFDVQAAAVAQTRARLQNAGLLGRATLLEAGHEHIAECVREPVMAVVFNLGWLPGGDKSVTTRWDTTKIALEGALSLLLPGGVCVVCVYPGHPEGEREGAALHAFCASLSNRAYCALWQSFVNAGPGAPECVVLQRL